MALPAGVTTRTVTLGPGVTVEAGDALGVQATVKASRDLVWAATGTAVRSVEKVYENEAGLELEFELPVTDQEGWLLNGAVVDVSDGKQSHYYNITVKFYAAGSAQPVSVAVIGPISIPTGDGSPIDADKLIPATTAGGATISLPDSWSEAVAQAQAAAAEAAAALVDSDAFVETKVAGDIPDAETPIGSALLASMHAQVRGLRVLPSLTQFAVYGESTTESTGTNWPATILPTMLSGVTVDNMGVSGQGAADVLVRAGAIRPRVTLNGGQIPTSGAVTVTTIDPEAGWRISGSGSFTFTGTLAGVAGTLAHSLVTNVWTFTRTASGSAVTVPAGTEFLIDASYTRPYHSLIVFTGRNNVTNGTLPIVDALLTQAVAAQNTQVKRLLVLGTINGTDEPQGSSSYTRIAASNARRATMFGDAYLDVRAGFLARGLVIAGIIPTTADTNAINQGCPPPSLMDDTIHPNAAGYRVIAYLVAEKLAALGWATATLPPIVPRRTIVTSDSFNRADTAPGTLGTSDAALGGTAMAWATDAQIQVIGNQIGAAAITSQRIARMTPGSVDHAVFAKVGAMPGGQRLHVRYNSNTETYAVVIKTTGGLILNRYSSGTTTLTNFLTNPQVGDTWGFGAVNVAGGGVRLVVWLNDALVEEFTDTTAGALTTQTVAGWGFSSGSDIAIRADDLAFYTLT